MFKYKILLLCIVLFFIESIYIVKANTLPLIGKIIYIDPGHGGIDPGAIYKNMKESNINLEYAREIGNLLEHKGATIYYTRDGDYDLAIGSKRRKKSDLRNRVILLNNSNADLYLSIHMNSENTGLWYGSQIFYNENNLNNKKIAQAIQNDLKKNNISKRDISIIKGLYMYENITIPGVLIEVGFISNYSDRKKIESSEFMHKFSNILVGSIIKYFNN